MKPNCQNASPEAAIRAASRIGLNRIRKDIIPVLISIVDFFK